MKGRLHACPGSGRGRWQGCSLQTMSFLGWQAACLELRAGWAGRLHISQSQRCTKSMTLLNKLCNLLLEAA